MPGLAEGVGRTSPATGMAKGTFHERQTPGFHGFVANGWISLVREGHQGGPDRQEPRLNGANFQQGKRTAGARPCLVSICA